MDIGFIGLGNMGQPMASRLIDAGYSLAVFDVRPDAVEALQAKGARAALVARRGGVVGRDRPR